MSFVDYCISKGYKPYRKVYSKHEGWKYEEDYTHTDYFSTCSPNNSDLRLIKDGNEIVYGLEYVNADMSCHFPTLIWPKIFGDNVESIDKAFQIMTNEEILYKIEHWFDLEKISKLRDGE